jgi:hypothetical protein
MAKRRCLLALVASNRKSNVPAKLISIRRRSLEQV